MRPTFVYDINNVNTKLYMWSHVSGGVLCNEYCIRSDHEENHSHFIISLATRTSSGPTSFLSHTSSQHNGDLHIFHKGSRTVSFK